MVAFTDTQLLPYQVGNDRPCDADSVWCDFVELLESNLVATDALLARLSPARPVARILRSTSITVASEFLAPIPWESVDFDTDGVVDLAQNSFVIPVTRNGTFYITGEVKVTGETPGNSVEMFITVGFVDSVGSGSASVTASEQFRVPGAGSNYFLRASGYHVLRPTTSDRTFGIALTDSTGPVSITVLRASLSLYWISDEYINLFGS